MPGPSFTARLQEIEQDLEEFQRIDEVEEPSIFYRFSYGLSFGYGGTYAIHGEYYGGLIQAWSFDRKSLIDAGPRLEAELKQHVLDWLVEQFGSSVDVGFLPLNDGAGVQEAGYAANLDERVKWRIEDSEGRAVDSGEDEL